MKNEHNKTGNKKTSFDELLKLVTREGSPSLCIDSRLVKKDDIFIAIKGAHLDGHNFLDQSVKNGAKIIIAQKNLCTIPSSTHYELVLVDNTAEAAALLAQAKKGNPASKLINLAVTGTNGKTTTAFLVRSIIRSTGQRCGLIGTVQYDTGEQTCQSKLTTPDPFTIADITSQMVAAGAKFMITEASSHALDQDRLAGLQFAAAAFTNLTGDHLDYHKTKENYLAAKIKLFQHLSPNATAVLNKQSPQSKYIASQTAAKILLFAVDEPADISAHIQSMNTVGTNFILEYNGHKHTVRTPLLGKFNISNCLAAAGLAIAAGFRLDTISAALSNPDIVPGRFQKINTDKDFTILVDYAHTDDALKNVLETIKPLCTGRLIVVFGCGGDRDRTKRPRMAKVAEHFADLIIVTSDNPRTENPQQIINEIVAGFENGSAIPSAEFRATGHEPRVTSDESRATKIIEPDRKTAIGNAIENAQKNDIILIAGKGHENYQILADKTIHFSDEEVALEFLQKKNEAALSK